MTESAKPSISVQWHITTDCCNRCKHCYMYDEKTYFSERKNTLSDSALVKALESILDFEKKWGFNVKGFAVSGGDPLMRGNWFEFMSAIKAHGKTLSVMGNPETLSDENLLKLKELGLRKFQMSLDGLEAEHDKFRSKGSFVRTVEAITMLEQHGISSQIMFTLYPENRNDLFPLIEYLVGSTPLSYFYFDIGTSSGNANTLSKEFSKTEIREILGKYLQKKEEIKTINPGITLGEKSHLFTILKAEKRQNDFLSYKSFPIIEGCLAGWFSVSILSDGSVLSCRRLPIVAGKMPEQTFEEIFLGSEQLKKFRRREYFTGCGSCKLYQYCRGCPAYVYGISGDPFAEHLLCFKRNNDGITSDESACSNAPLTTTYEEEARFIASAAKPTEKDFTNKLIKEHSFRELYLRLIEDIAQIELFLKDKNLYVKSNDIQATETDLYLLQVYFRSLLDADIFNKKENLERLMGFVKKLKMYHINR